MSRIRGYLAVALASSALTALGGAAGLDASTTVAPSNTARPTISGTAADGQTLTASVGSWSGTAPISYSYRWQRCDSRGAGCRGLSGADKSTYKVTGDDIGHRLALRVAARNSSGNSAATSEPTAVVTPNPDTPANTAKPTITGVAQPGSVLTGQQGSWSGKAPLSFSYRWMRCNSTGTCSPLGGQTRTTYTVSTGDAGSRIRFRVTAKNDSGSTSALSDGTAVVVGKPVATAKPTISGTPQQGSTLTASPGTWSGTQPITLTFQWERCDSKGGGCVTLTGATRTTYLLTNPDVGRRMRVRVRAANSAGADASTSNATPVIAAPTSTTPALPPGGIKLPDGSISIPVTSVSLPDQLIIDKVAFTPRVLSSRAPFQARFHVVNTKGYVVRDALVYIVGIPYGRILNVPEQPTAQDGWVTMTVQPTAKFPLVRGGSLVIFVRARKAGDNLLAGVSARRLVQVTTSSPR
jgi:hypothetical protein